jgi:xanthine dehydrogenase accessory factor
LETTVFDILKKAVENQKKSIAFVLATVVVGIEKTPGRSGFKLLSYPDGSSEGTVGGGKLERIVLDKCREIHKTHKNDFLEFKLTDNSDGIGMECGGVAKVFLEYYSPSKKVYIFGAGHLCRSLVPILNSIGFYTIIVDNRKDFANKDKIPEAKEVYAQDYLDYISNFHPLENDAIVIFTHGHKYDYDILDYLCGKNVDVKYLGMIGSKIKVIKAVNNIKGKKYKGDLIEKIYAPIGLNIGKTTTQEIAIAIAAEILAVYNEVGNVCSMRDKLD